jgi:alkylated DNA repair protein alkB family protein 1
VFLIGGATKSVRPTALMLRSGDCVLMTADARRSFHAVPRIVDDSSLTQTIEPHVSDSDSQTDFCLKYLDKHRININIRQVF